MIDSKKDIMMGFHEMDGFYTMQSTNLNDILMRFHSK